MKVPPVFELCSTDATIQSIFGVNPCRVYPFGEAPEKTSDHYAFPYSVWQIITGFPENNLSKTPDIDQVTTQFDVYGLSVSDVRNAANELSRFLESSAYVTSWRGETKNTETGVYRISFDMAWYTER